MEARMSRVAGKGLWVGEQGDSVFTEPYIDYQFQPNQLPGFLQKIDRAGDDRSFVLVTAVVVERYLDELLQAIAPGYHKLADQRDFTFSLKIELLKAFGLIPPHIVQAADLLRKVRNEFAHNIECERLQHLNEGLRTAMAQRVRELFGDETPHSSSPRAILGALTFVALAGLQSYRVNLSALRDKLEEGTLTASLKDECHKRFISQIEATKTQSPLRVEERQGWRYTYYEKGIVDISPADPNNPPTTVNIDISEMNWNPTSDKSGR
jgi:hypothetical protein